MGKSIGIDRLMKKKFKLWGVDQQWVEVVGDLEQCFTMLIWGKPGSGKTTFTIQLCKALARKKKVYYNSIEQGESKSLQNVVKLVDLSGCKGRIVFGDRDTFDEMIVKLKRNRAGVVVIDSAQYANFTKAQYQLLLETYKRKAIIVISWEGSGGNPKGEHTKAMRYMVDVKVHIRSGQAMAQSRFGQTRPYKIFDQVQAGEQIPVEPSNGEATREDEKIIIPDVPAEDIEKVIIN